MTKEAPHTKLGTEKCCSCKFREPDRSSSLLVTNDLGIQFTTKREDSKQSYLLPNEVEEFIRLADYRREEVINFSDLDL